MTGANSPAAVAPPKGGSVPEDGVPGTPNGPLLEVRNLAIDLGGRPVVDGIGFSVGPGQLTTLSGPNGSGKTSILRAILGELPYRGTIRLGTDADHPGTGVGYVPQVFTFDPSLPMNVADLFGLSAPGRPLFFRRRPPDAMPALLERVGARGLERRLLGELSGGELRRVLLAVALLGRPRLMLLDEPAASVDDAGAERFDELLTQLCREEALGLLVVTHGRPRLEAAADLRIRLDPSRPLDRDGSAS